MDPNKVQQIENFDGGKPIADDKMKKAYEVSAELVRDRLKEESEEDLNILEEAEEEDVICVDGNYDHIHQVLELSKIPFIRIQPDDLTNIQLRPDQTIFINCGNAFPAEAARKVSTFVTKGGQLITTDWALKHVIEQAFPGTIRYNEKPTGDEVVRIEILDNEDPILKGFLDEETDPLWWLEGSSYPIEIIDTDKVEVLIRSKELGENYGEDPVVVKFEHHEGIVYHMISHFYLQRTETRDNVQTQAASAYSMSKGASPKTQKAFEEAEKEVGLDYGTVQSTNTSAEFVSRAIINQKKRYKNKQPKSKKEESEG